MPFKPPTDAPFERLSTWSVMTATGADAEAFLQAQTMNDVRALAPGHWHWNGWLTPKGRVVAIFAVVKQAPDRFLLACVDHPAGDLAAALRRFVFRSKVVLAATDGIVAAAGPPHPDAAGARVAAGTDGTVVLDFSGDGGVRTLWLRPAGQDGAPSPAADAAWLVADIAHGLPRLGPAQREAWTPQMLSLERLAAFSLKKGCYPGQEIVARTHYLGRARRGLARVGGAAVRAGDPVFAGDREVGTVVCAAPAGDALVVLAADAGDALAAAVPATGDRNVTPVTLHRLPLLEGLARR